MLRGNQENRLLGLELTPRDDNGAAVDFGDTDLVDLYDRHHDSDEKTDAAAAAAPAAGGASASTQSLPSAIVSKPRSGTIRTAPSMLGSPSTQTVPVVAASAEDQLRHLLLAIKELPENSDNDEMQYFFSLYSGRSNTFIFDEYCVRQDKVTSFGSSLQTIFRDISRSELDSELYLVCRVVRYGPMLLSEVAPVERRRSRAAGPGPLMWRSVACCRSRRSRRSFGAPTPSEFYR